MNSEDKQKKPEQAKPRCPNKSSCNLILVLVENKEHLVCLNCNKTVK